FFPFTEYLPVSETGAPRMTVSPSTLANAVAAATSANAAAQPANTRTPVIEFRISFLRGLSDVGPSEHGASANATGLPREGGGYALSSAKWVSGGRSFRRSPSPGRSADRRCR